MRKKLHLDRVQLTRIVLALCFTAGLVTMSMTDRTHFGIILLLYSVCFGIYLVVLRTPGLRKSLYFWIGVGMLTRFCLIFFFPNLSDDIYRFIWDGRLVLSGINPYAYTPDEIIRAGEQVNIPGLHTELFLLLNSPGYYSIYPPFCQVIFLLSAWISPHDLLTSAMTMKSVVFLFEGSTIFLLLHLLKCRRQDPRNVLIYALNPLVIVELSGNVHFEFALILFLLIAIYFLERGRWSISAFFWACSIITKLIPLIFLPLLLRRLKWQIWLPFFGALGVLLVGLFYPVWSLNLTDHFSASLGLYFQTFEFNASLYYILRQAGYLLKGYNMIFVIGPGLALLTLGAILMYVFLERVPTLRNIPTAMVVVLTIYLLCSTTVHPWYLTPMIALVPLTNLRYPVLWSGLVILSYAAYQSAGNTENLYLVGIEYGVLMVGILAEFRYHSRIIP